MLQKHFATLCCLVLAVITMSCGSDEPSGPPIDPNPAAGAVATYRGNLSANNRIYFGVEVVVSQVSEKVIRIAPAPNHSFLSPFQVEVARLNDNIFNSGADANNGSLLIRLDRQPVTMGFSTTSPAQSFDGIRRDQIGELATQLAGNYRGTAVVGTETYIDIVVAIFRESPTSIRVRSGLNTGNNINRTSNFVIDVVELTDAQGRPNKVFRHSSLNDDLIDAFTIDMSKTPATIIYRLKTRNELFSGTRQ